MAADGGVGGMEDRPVRMIALVRRRGPDKEKIAVAQDRLKRGHLRVGAQDEDPVEARLLGELARIDLE